MIKTLGVTGHRPERLGGYDLLNRRALGALAVEHLVNVRPERVLTGMAQGWDHAMAAASIALDIPFTAVLPFVGQEDRWPPVARSRYRRLLDKADAVQIVSQSGTGRGFREMMQLRNEWIVDHSDGIAALYDGGRGGTANTLAYANRRGVPVRNLWADWVLPEDMLELL